MDCLRNTVRRIGSKPVRAIKTNLLKTFPAECYICKIPLNLYNCTLDHLIPRSLGGTNNIKNTAIACNACNNEKNSDLDKDQIDYIINRIGFVPNCVEDFVDALRNEKMILENSNYNQLMSKLIYFYYKGYNESVVVNKHIVYEIPGRNNTRTSHKSKKISNLTRQNFLDSFEGTHQCFICSDTHDLIVTKIIGNNYGGTININNAWLLCAKCANETSNEFEKYRINYILNRDFKDHKEWIPNSVEDIIKHLEFLNIIREDISEQEYDKLLFTMKEIFE